MRGAGISVRPGGAYFGMACFGGPRSGSGGRRKKKCETADWLQAFACGFRDWTGLDWLQRPDRLNTNVQRRGAMAESILQVAPKASLGDIKSDALIRGGRTMIQRGALDGTEGERTVSEQGRHTGAGTTDGHAPEGGGTTQQCRRSSSWTAADGRWLAVAPAGVAARRRNGTAVPWCGSRVGSTFRPSRIPRSAWPEMAVPDLELVPHRSETRADLQPKKGPVLCNSV